MEYQNVETTLYSLSGDTPEAPEERRSGERHMTIYRVGALVVDGRRELCLIKNISEGGMMVRAYCGIPPGTQVSIELKTGQMVAGSVSWAKEPNLGIAFDTRIDVLEMLSQSMEGPRPRMPRVETMCAATIRDGASIMRTSVHDISQGGVKVDACPEFVIGADVVVSIPGFEPQPGVIRWIEGSSAGLSFNRLLPLATLIDWLRDQRTELRRAG